MGRLALAVVVLALLAPATASPHPGHGPPVVAIAEFAYAPTKVTVVEGDYVFWDWQGPDANHSVTADSGQAFTFDSDPTGSPDRHKVGDGYSVQFTKAGTWTYHCSIHSFMKGTVEVLKANAVPVATPPRVSKVTIALAGRRLTLRFRVNQAVSMRATVRRAGGGGTLREFDFPGPPGANRRILKLGALHAGRYRLAVVAVDSSTGKATKAVVRSFTVT